MEEIGLKSWKKLGIYAGKLYLYGDINARAKFLIFMLFDHVDIDEKFLTPWPVYNPTILERLSQKTNNMSPSKQSQLSHLNSQLLQLQSNLQDFHEHIKDTCCQFESIQELGVIHGSIFMACHRVFDKDNFDNASDEE